jgi:hypothetical protein
MGDRGCAACRRAFEDLATPRDWESRGVRVAVLVSDAIDARGLPIGPGAVPVYLLVDGEGRVLARRRGYTPPALLERWARAAFGIPAGES